MDCLNTQVIPKKHPYGGWAKFLSLSGILYSTEKKYESEHLSSSWKKRKIQAETRHSCRAPWVLAKICYRRNIYLFRAAQKKRKIQVGPWVFVKIIPSTEPFEYIFSKKRNTIIDPAFLPWSLSFCQNTTNGTILNISSQSSSRAQNSGWDPAFMSRSLSFRPNCTSERDRAS